MAGDLLLRVTGLSKSFGAVQALNDVGFELRQGEALGVIGPNGSGKSTLINLITGFVKPTAGRVELRGRDITGIAPHRLVNLGVARSFQMARPFYNLPVYKNVVIAVYSPRSRKNLGAEFGDRDEAAMQLLEDVGFERDSQVPFKKAGELPHGYLKRLELARCLALDPDLLILDEFLGHEHVGSREHPSAVGADPCRGQDALDGRAPPPRAVSHRRFRPRAPLRPQDRRRRATGGDDQEGGGRSLPGRRGKGLMLEVRSLMVFYENALAVNDLDLSVERGEVVGVFGSNSAGKTTLLNTIAGLTLHLAQREQRKGGMRITIHGTVTFAGERIDALPPRARVEKGIVLCRERHPVLRGLTVEENLKLGGYLRPEREVKGAISETYELFPSLARARRRRAGVLSGGEQEMLAIGMALAARPALLLLDEPLLGLSPHMQNEVVRGAKEISRRGVTILVAEQYARPLAHIIDRAYVIENGSLVLSGTGAELIDNPEVKAAYFGV